MTRLPQGHDIPYYDDTTTAYYKYEYEIIFLFNDILRLTHQGRESTVVGCCSDILYEDATTKSDASTTVVRGQLVTPV